MSLRYLTWRLGQMIPVLLGVSIVVFYLLRLIPGDPALVMLGDRATPASLARLHQELGLNAPIYQQYVIFIKDALHGNFGASFIYQTSVASVTLSRLPLTAQLILYSALLAMVIALPFATFAAAHRGGWIDQAIRLIFTTALGVPSFWLGIMLALYLGVRLSVFPVGGPGTGGLDTVWHLTLPALTIAVSMSPLLVRSLRSALIGVLGSDYVMTGRAMGLRRRTLTYSYLLRNSILPVVLVLSINIGWLLSGSVIVEQVFGLPGVGSLLVNSINTRDYGFIQLVTLIFALVVVTVNLLTDLLYAVIDPRVRLGR